MHKSNKSRKRANRMSNKNNPLKGKQYDSVQYTSAFNQMGIPTGIKAVFPKYLTVTPSKPTQKTKRFGKWR